MEERERRWNNISKYYSTKHLTTFGCCETSHNRSIPAYFPPSYLCTSSLPCVGFVTTLCPENPFLECRVTFPSLTSSSNIRPLGSHSTFFSGLNVLHISQFRLLASFYISYFQFSFVPILSLKKKIMTWICLPLKGQYTCILTVWGL